MLLKDSRDLKLDSGDWAFKTVAGILVFRKNSTVCESPHRNGDHMVGTLIVDGWIIDFKAKVFRKDDAEISFDSEKGRGLMYKAILVLDIDSMVESGYRLGI